ncbi:MAG: ATP-binding protein [Rubrivivax sp.]|nr:ATP-binding protein [Rubrivivax sp.]
MPAGPIARARRIAIVGAESTGKTTLARELVAALAGDGERVALVGEWLREWCDAEGRTPRRDEQHGILVEQHRRIDAAAVGHDWVVCDTTGLATHVYSELLFDDRSLLAPAVAGHRGMALTLLTALDLPWVPDGHQRDGEHVREPVDTRLRAVLMSHGMPFAVVAGHGPARLAQALAALRPLRAAASPAHGPRPASATAGLFTAPGRRRAWICECCVPEAEAALMRRGN